MTSRALRLPLCLDSDRLKTDLALVGPQDWVPHYNEGEYGGAWSGVALRSASREVNDLVSHGADRTRFADTPLLERCAYFREVLAAFQCPLRSVRLLSLGPGSSIREHTDPDFEGMENEVRLHVPIRTNPGVEFYLEGHCLRLEEGACYYIDAGRPHRVVNRGVEDRVHLVIDAAVNDWLLDRLRGGQSLGHFSAPLTSFDAFREVVFSDVDLQRTLSAIPHQDAFVEAVVCAGRERGFGFYETEVQRTAGPVPGCHDRRHFPRQNWLPVSVRFYNATPFAKWVYFSGRLLEPFFDTSLRNALRVPFARTFQREEPIGPVDTVRVPSGFIFHMSRCGSTLVAQMLAALERACVVSEAPAVNDVICAGLQTSSLGDDERVAWLRAIVSALGQRSAAQDLYFVKLDSWHIHRLPLIRRAFPSTPWVFLYRDPLDVLLSQLRSPGQVSLPGAIEPGVLDMRVEDVTGLSRAEWCARALAGFCRSALRFAGEPGGLFLNYDRLPEAGWTILATHFGISFSGDEIRRMRQTACFDAKRPSAGFQPYSDREQGEPEPAILELADGLLRPLYLQLEELAGKQSEA